MVTSPGRGSTPGDRHDGVGGGTAGVHPAVDRLAAYSWRLIVVGVVAWALVWLLGTLRLVFFPVVIALFINVILASPARSLRAHGWPPLVTTWAVFGGFLAALALAGALIVPAIADEFADLGPTISQGIDDFEAWLVEDSPLELDRRRVDELRDQLEDTVRRAATGSGGLILRSAVLIGEVAAGTVLALVLAFFFLKDGERFQAWALRQLPEERRELARRLAARAWQSVGGYLRGSAALGAIEAVVIGLTLALVGGALVIPIMFLTFLAAFVPIAGAVVAGLVAVLVAAVTAGFVPMLIVAVVAIVVQQLDNDLLAPLVFGRTLDLHPVIILVAVAAGATLGGVAGAFLAVPTAAVAINVGAEARSARAG